MNPSNSSLAAAARLITLKQVCQRTGLGRTSTYELIAQGKHPAPVKLGRSSRWVDREVDQWVEQIVAARGL